MSSLVAILLLGAVAQAEISKREVPGEFLKVYVRDDQWKPDNFKDGIFIPVTFAADERIRLDGIDDEIIRENIGKNKHVAFYDGQLKSAEYFILTVLPITIGKMNSIKGASSTVVEIAEASFGG